MVGCRNKDLDPSNFCVLRMRIKLQFININVKIPLVEFLFNTNEHARVTFMPCKKNIFLFYGVAPAAFPTSFRQFVLCCTTCCHAKGFSVNSTSETVTPCNQVSSVRISYNCCETKHNRRNWSSPVKLISWYFGSCYQNKERTIGNCGNGRHMITFSE